MKHGLSCKILLVLLCASLFSACGFEAEEHIGLYSCEALSLEGEEFQVSDIYPDGLTLELLSYGQAWLSINGEAVYGRWTLEGESFTLDIGGELSTGNLTAGVCRLRLAGSEIEHTLLRSGAVLPEPEIQAEPEKEASERQLFWNGDWYGFWKIENATGKWLEQSGQSFDCFARFDIAPDNTGTMIFWDELQSADAPIARVELLISDSADNSVSGVAVSTGGYFYDSEIEETQWSVEPGTAPVDSMFIIENGRFESESGSFDYKLMLRPWGRTWEDVEAADPALVPYFYYDWYLQMLASGEAMPDEFEPPERTVVRDVWYESEEITDK